MTGPRIIVADADPHTRTVVTWLLRERGHVVTPVDTADGVAEAIAAGPADLLLMGFSGDAARQAMASVRASERAVDLPVLAAVDRLGDAESHVAAAGITDVVARPLVVTQLLARVDAQLRLREALRAARERTAALEQELLRLRAAQAVTAGVIDVVQDVVNEGSASGIFRVLTRRLADALGLTWCSIVLATPGEPTATIAVACDDTSLQDITVTLANYPEIVEALATRLPVLVEDWSHDARRLAIGSPAPWTARVRSCIVMPFTLDPWRVGVLFMRTGRAARALTAADLEFAAPILDAAVASLRRTQVLESTRADNQRLVALATTDPLTRLLNRRAFHERLAEEVQRAQRYGSILTLLMLDVDHFKVINDTYGHLVGDTVLAQLAGTLLGSLRTVDIAARYGGEEFVAILPETPLDGGVVIAERLRERVRRQEFAAARGVPLHLTVSVGAAVYPSPHTATMEDLIARADEALYRAKGSGRNQVRT